MLSREEVSAFLVSENPSTYNQIYNLANDSIDRIGRFSKKQERNLIVNAEASGKGYLYLRTAAPTEIRVSVYRGGSS